tara:strand:+ start:1342 stop:4290 length:2949 start_codon:yes stop_codon:yes gene_type:complete
MADATLLAYLQELMETYDSTISTTSGSTFRTTVIDPFLKRIGDSPLDGDLETFLVDRLKEEHPDLDVTQYSGIRDLVIRPMATMLAPISREITAVKNSQSFNNHSLMTRAELNALMGNYFLSIKDGSLATGTVRMYFSTPQAVVVTSLTEFSTKGGLVFYPSSVTALTSGQMSFNQEGTLFYMDVDVTSAATGTEYNVAAGSITKVTGVDGVVRLTNTAAISAGTADETMEEAVARAKASITTRTLSTTRGVSTVVLDNFPTLSDLQVIGFGDAEMIRDVATGISDISGVPGGFDTAPISTSANSVHIGGKTDVYIEQASKVPTSLNITNITDVGRRVMFGTTGFTSDSGDATNTFKDGHGNFILQGVKVGDWLKLGPEVDSSDALVITQRQISGVAASALTLAGSGIPTGLTDVPYEIVQYDATTESLRNFIYVPLYDMVAVDSTGAVVTNADGNPVYPVPGDVSNSAATYTTRNPLDPDDVARDGSYVEKDDNVSVGGNVYLPLFRASQIDRLDPTSLEVVTGQNFPRADVLYAEALSDFTDTGYSSRSYGTLRIYFADPVSACTPSLGFWSYGHVDSTDDDPDGGEENDWDRSSTPATSDRTGISPSLLSESSTGRRKAGSHIGNLPITRFTFGSHTYIPTPITLDSGFTAWRIAGAQDSSNKFQFNISGDHRAHISKGMWVNFDRNKAPRLITSVTFGGGNTKVVMRAMPDEVDPLSDYTGSAHTTPPSLDGTYGWGLEGGQSEGTSYDARKGSLVFFWGQSYDSMQQDATSGLYYFDVPVTKTESGAATVPKGTKFTAKNVYAEGWTVQSRWEGYAFSTKERPYLKLSNWVRDQYLRYVSTAYAIRVLYEYTDDIRSVQTFLERDEYRIVSEDVLAKSFLPRLVSGTIKVKGITADAGLIAATNYINSIEPDTNLEVSDLVSALYTAGASYVELPVNLTIKNFDQLRNVTSEVVQDTALANRIQHFLTDSITITVVP